jgi:putative endonuclease
MEEKFPAVYMMSNGARGTLYIGVTSALWNRVACHKDEGVPGFTAKHGLKGLVLYEHHKTMLDAIKREKQLKKWNRDWKIRIIEDFNPHWIDLHNDIDFERFYVPEKLGPRLRGGDGNFRDEMK